MSEEIQRGPVLIVHPDDFPDLAEIKASAARLGLDAQHSQFIPRGQAMVCWRPSIAWPINLTVEHGGPA